MRDALGIRRTWLNREYEQADTPLYVQFLTHTQIRSAKHSNPFFRKNNILFNNWARDILCRMSHLSIDGMRVLVCLCVCAYYVTFMNWIYRARHTELWYIFGMFFFPLCIDNVLNVPTHASESNSKYENWKSHISTRIAEERNGFWERGEKYHCWELVVMLVGMNVSKNVGFVATMFRSNLPGNIDNSSVNLILPVVSLCVCECGYGCHDLCRLSTVSGVSHWQPAYSKLIKLHSLLRLCVCSCAWAQSFTVKAVVFTSLYSFCSHELHRYMRCTNAICSMLMSRTYW